MSSVKETAYRILNSDLLRPFYFRSSYLYYSALRKRILRRVAEKQRCRVAFVVSSLAMWKMEVLLEKLMKDERFAVEVMILPFDKFSKEEKERNRAELVSYMKGKNVVFHDVLSSGRKDELWTDFDPDVVFYPQPYRNLYQGAAGIKNNLGRLVCYVPYSFNTVIEDWAYNNYCLNVFWRLFYYTKIHYELARTHSFNHGRNVVVTGDPHADAFLTKECSYAWKKQDREKKRVIWAPHYSIRSGGELHRDSFLWTAGLMLRLVEQYKDRIQFCMKPHPRLLTELYSYPGWGKERADAYYRAWEEGENTQLETGDYVGLFSTSDALIHDCGSFTAEYLYTKNPVIFLSRDFDALGKELDIWGMKCLDVHYKGSREKDVTDFVEKVVLAGEDPMRKERTAFYSDILVPEADQPAGERIYASLCRSLFGDGRPSDGRGLPADDGRIIQSFQ